MILIKQASQIPIKKSKSANKLAFFCSNFDYFKTKAYTFT
tara:strand:- start:3577 stop:3696 length:120 start_codon:yes stop_codon:yes gene_type:complete